MSTETIAPNNCPSCQSSFNPELFDAEKVTFCPKCRFPLMLIAGKYRLKRLINQGGFGRLYLAQHIGLELFNERVIKVLKRELFLEPGILRRFRREVQLTANLSEQNSHIVRIYDDFGDEPQLGHYYIMEYLRGSTLNAIMETSKPLDYGLVFHIFYQLCRAMGAAHRASVIHRDLKPDNIFLIQRDADPHFVKVIDFGLARPEGPGGGENTAITQQQVMGTPAYMSPEQCSGEDIDTRSDIYALGIILYQMLSGRHPFPVEPGDTMGLFFAHLSKTPTTILAYMPEFPSGLDHALQVALAKAPRDRHATIEDFWNAIVSFAPSSSNYPPLSSPGSVHIHSASFQSQANLYGSSSVSLEPLAFEATVAGVEAISADVLEEDDGDETFISPSGGESLKYLAGYSDQLGSDALDSHASSLLLSPESEFEPTKGLPSFSQMIQTGEKEASFSKELKHTPLGHEPLSSVSHEIIDEDDDEISGFDETGMMEAFSEDGLAAIKKEMEDAVAAKKEMEDAITADLEGEGSTNKSDASDKVNHASGSSSAVPTDGTEQDKTGGENVLLAPLEEADTGDLEDDLLEDEETSIGVAPSFSGEKVIHAAVNNHELMTLKDQKLPHIPNPHADHRIKTDEQTVANEMPAISSGEFESLLDSESGGARTVALSDSGSHSRKNRTAIASVEIASAVVAKPRRGRKVVARPIEQKNHNAVKKTPVPSTPALSISTSPKPAPRTKQAPLKLSNSTGLSQSKKSFLWFFLGIGVVAVAALIWFFMLKG